MMRALVHGMPNGRRHRSNGVVVSLVFALALSPISAHAAPPDTARELAAAAANKARSAEFDAAVALYEQAFAQDPSPVLLLNIAVIRDRQGRVFDAIEAYERHLALEDDPAARKASAERLAVIRVGAPGRVSVTGVPPGAEVFIDGRSVGRVPIAAADLPAGTYALRISHPGYVALESTVTVTAGSRKTVEAALAPVQTIMSPPTVPAGAAPSLDEVASDEDDDRTMWIWIGVGTALAVGTAITLGLVYGLDDGGTTTVAPRPADRTWTLGGSTR